MADLPFFEDDGKKSLSGLLDLRGKYRADSIVIAIDDRLQRSSIEPNTHAETIILAIEELERRVNGDGFESFFENEPQYAKDIVSFLQQAHCPNTAKIVERAVNKLELEDLSNLEEIQSKSLDVDFDEEDNEFMAYPDDIVERLLDYISENQNSIRLPGTTERVSLFKRIFSKK
jgi:hypothetical protein